MCHLRRDLPDHFRFPRAYCRRLGFFFFAGLSFRLRFAPSRIHSGAVALEATKFLPVRYCDSDLNIPIQRSHFVLARDGECRLDLSSRESLEVRN